MHFTVMVFGKDPQTQLEPYDKNLGEQCKDPKFDWYLLGGRWAGFFKAKDPSLMIVGNNGAFNHNNPINGFGDLMAKGNIDIDGMKEYYNTECIDFFFLPRAFVYNEEWYEINDSTNKNEYEKFRTLFWNTFNDLSDDTLVALYDCHI